MKQPILQTTIVGSLPKPAWLAEPRKLWAPWLLQGEALAEGLRDAVRLVLRERTRLHLETIPYPFCRANLLP